MNADLQRLLAAIPFDDEADDAEVRALVEQRSIPTGRLARLWTLGTMQAQIAVAYASMWMRSLFDPSQQSLVETHLAAAMRLASGMVYLRGAVMKIGQALASYPNLVPHEISSTLERLHFNAPPMHFALVREQLENELDREIADVFSEFDERAFAAASLGQVHRARLRGGERVAVKIQYPGIARTIESDFRNLMLALAPLRFTRDWDCIAAQLDDVRKVITAEVDYYAEADSLERARTWFDEADGIVVPRVFREHSTARVLTMDYIDGMHADSWLATSPSQEQRNAFGAKMYTASFRMYYAGKSDYADPHPGNYLFLDDGRLGLIDFGCMRAYDEYEWRMVSDMDRAFYSDRATLRTLLVRFCDFNDAEARDERRMALLEESFRWIVEPLMHDEFDFADGEHLRLVMDIMGRAIARRYTRSHPMQLMLSRTLIGLRSVLYRIGARVRVREIHEAELRRSGWSWVNEVLQ